MADLSHYTIILRDALGKEKMSPVDRRAAVGRAREKYGVSERRARQALLVRRAMVRS